MISLLLAKFPSNSLLLMGNLLHLRCYAHILNLVVNDGLDTIVDGIKKIETVSIIGQHHLKRWNYLMI